MHKHLKGAIITLPIIAYPKNDLLPFTTAKNIFEVFIGTFLYQVSALLARPAGITRVFRNSS